MFNRICTQSIDAGLSAGSMMQFGYRYLYKVSHSFVIYDSDKQIDSGDWAGTDPDLVWVFQQ